MKRLLAVAIFALVVVLAAAARRASDSAALDLDDDTYSLSEMALEYDRYESARADADVWSPPTLLRLASTISRVRSFLDQSLRDAGLRPPKPVPHGNSQV